MSGGVGRVWRAMTAVVLAVLMLAGPASAEHGPRYDVACPTGSAEVVLDPGHGGEDPGAIQGTYGFYEAQVNLEVAERAAQILREEHGYAVALTRADNDTTLANSERGEIANACGAVAFVEIHHNAWLDPELDFTTTFWGEMEKDLAFSLVMNEAIASLGIPVEDVARFDNGGLLRARMPSVLVETVFLSNPEEAIDLANGTRQESLARAIAEGVHAWMTLTAEEAA